MVCQLDEIRLEQTKLTPNEQKFIDPINSRFRLHYFSSLTWETRGRHHFPASRRILIIFRPSVSCAGGGAAKEAGRSPLAGAVPVRFRCGALPPAQSIQEKYPTVSHIKDALENFR